MGVGRPLFTHHRGAALRLASFQTLLLIQVSFVRIRAVLFAFTRSIVFSNICLCMHFIHMQLASVSKSGFFHREQILGQAQNNFPRRDHPVRLRLPPLHGRGILLAYLTFPTVALSRERLEDHEPVE